MLQVIGGDEARSDMTTGRLAELDERANQLKLRMGELRDELAAAQRETVSAAQSSMRGRALRILHLLLESVVYDGATGELKMGFYPLGLTSLAAEAATIGQPIAVVA